MMSLSPLYLHVSYPISRVKTTWSTQSFTDNKKTSWNLFLHWKKVANILTTFYLYKELSTTPSLPHFLISIFTG